MKNFAGFDLDAVFREEEERLKQEERRKVFEGKKQGVQGSVKKPDNSLAVSNTPLIVSYQDVLFEERAFRAQGKSDKKLCYFNDSLAELRARGFARHARSQEVFGLLMAGLEGRLSGSLKGICDDLLTSYGEWLSLAFERQGDILSCYLDPEGLVWDGTQYVKAGFKCLDQRNFNIAGKFSQQLIDLSTFGDDFVQYVYGRCFKDLPSVMREGPKKAQACLPLEGIVWPVGRHGYVCVVDGYYYGSRASRGVVAAQKVLGGSGGGV